VGLRQSARPDGDPCRFSHGWPLSADAWDEQLLYFASNAFSETDFTEDLKKIDIPALILHGEEDQFVPVNNHAPLMAKLLKRSAIKIYPGAPHGLPMTIADRFNADVMAFIRG
jgi:non-heme chloroperoxidase